MSKITAEEAREIAIEAELSSAPGYILAPVYEAIRAAAARGQRSVRVVYPPSTASDRMFASTKLRNDGFLVRVDKENSDYRIIYW